MNQLNIRSGILFAIFAVLALSSATAHAATLNVTVTDAQSGEKLDRISIAVIPQTGDSREGTSDAMGASQFAELPAGIYSISVSSLSYADKAVPNVELQSDEEKSVEIALFSRVIQLDQVSVTTSRRQEKVLDAPAAISVLDDTQIDSRVAVTTTEHFKSLPAVDVFNTGITQSNVTVRGFSNVFSGSLLSLVDNRIARVPSLRVNAYNFIPTPQNDIERVEVVSGPGSALYGPNSANGVVHIITKPPFGSEGTRVSLGAGERGVLMGSYRHAGSFNNKIGYKLTGRYTQGEDWNSTDPVEEELRQQRIDAGVPEEEIKIGARDFDIQQIAGEARVDYRVNEDLTTIFNGGFTQASNIELTGIGAGQAVDWTYRYVQARALYKDLFAQAFWNTNDAGDTFLLRDGAYIIDKSSLFVTQLQHGLSLGARERLTYGVDMLLTRPDTEGTITGANEDDDSINEIGLYLQSETELTDQLRFIAAARLDNHNRLENPVFSPRAALVFKPAPDHNVRATYNRAFSTPNTNNLFLDIRVTEDPFRLGIDIRAQGVGLEGFHFSRSANGRPQFRSPFSPLLGRMPTDYIDLDDAAFANAITPKIWDAARKLVIGRFLSGVEQVLGAQGMPAEQIQAQIGFLSQALEVATPRQVRDVDFMLGILDPESQEFNQVDDAFDVDPMKPTITQTFEIGYKGTLFNKLLIGVDAYHTKIRDFVGPVTPETPSVLLDRKTLHASLREQFAATLDNPQNAIVNGALVAALDTNPLVGGDGDGSAVNELTNLFTRGGSSVPAGTVTPLEAHDPLAITATYRNFGDISLNGADFKFAYFLNENWNIGGNYSYVSKNLFENVDNLRDVALNAPSNKFGVSVEYLNAGLSNLAAQLRMRFVVGFPVNSGVYHGTVERYTTFDLSSGYDLPFSPNTRLSLTVQNLLNNEHQEFVGVPEIGRLSILRVTQNF